MGSRHGKMLIVNATRQDLEISGEAVQNKTTVTWHSQKEVDVVYGKAVVVTLPGGREIHFHAESQVLIDESRTGEVSKRPMRDDYRVLYVNTDHIQVFEGFQTAYMRDKLASVSRRTQRHFGTGPTISQGKASKVSRHIGRAAPVNEARLVFVDAVVAAGLVAFQRGRNAWDDERERQRSDQFKRAMELGHHVFAQATFFDLERHQKTMAEFANHLTDFLHEDDLTSLLLATAWGSIQGAAVGLVWGAGVSKASFGVGRWAQAANFYSGLSHSAFFLVTGSVFAAEVANCVCQYVNNETHARTCARWLISGGLKAGVNCCIGGLAFMPVQGTIVAVIAGVAWNLLDAQFHLSGDLATYFVEDTAEEMTFHTQELRRKLMRKVKLAFNFEEDETITYQDLKQRYRQLLLRLHPDKNKGQRHPFFHTVMAMFAILLQHVEGRPDDVSSQCICDLTQEALEDGVGRPHGVGAKQLRSGSPTENGARKKGFILCPLILTHA